MEVGQPANRRSNGMPRSFVPRISSVACLQQGANAAGLGGLTGLCVLGAGPGLHRTVR
jgi:hypothetical protein